MKRKKIETRKIGLVGQAPSRRGDPHKPLAGPNGQKIAHLAGMSYNELIACRRRHLNTHYGANGGNGFDHAKGKINAADVLMDWRVERIVLLGKNVARCFGFRDLAFSGGDMHLWTPVLDLSTSFWRQSVVERTTKRTTRSTTAAAVPTGSRWFRLDSQTGPFHLEAVAGNFSALVLLWQAWLPYGAN